MSNRNLSKAFQTFTREVTRLCRSMTKGTIDWLLRSAFVMSRGRFPNSGIILPTTIMLILVVSLSVGALTYRAYTRNIQAITSSQQRVIYNAATPAVDRARSKLEFMFDGSQDNRYPSGNVPTEDKLFKMMLNDGSDPSVPKLPISSTDPGNPYLLPGETQRDLPNTPGKDNAWSFRADTDGNGTEDATVVYSIIFKTPEDTDPAKSQQKLVTQSDKQKSDQGVVRHGPLTTETGSACQLPSSAVTAPTSVGWFNDPTNSSIVRKNFQVDVLVVPDSPKSVATTIEFHQDREISKGNKWGAWFRNDLEVFPGRPFSFNGAMHTEGSLIVGSNDGKKDNFQSFLISSKNSCLYPPIDNSEISITTGSDEDKFQGVLVAGTMGSITNQGGGFVAHYQESGQPKTLVIDSTNDTSRVDDPKNVYSDPIAILTADKRQTVKDATGSGANSKNNSLNYQAPTYVDALKQRIQFKKEPTPYIDDLSRADGRWGPKSTYPGGSAATETGSRPVPAGQYGATIVGSDNLYLITKNSFPPKTDAKDLTDESVGADGYWETRARNEGLRIMVGERLELGNAFGWVTPRDKPINGVAGASGDGYIDSDPTGLIEREGDPLYPPEVAPYPVASDATTISHLQQQRRTLRDNLAAVQATALYHTDFINTGLGPDYPFACLATTAHPGTPTTLRQSVNFVPTRFKSGTTDVDLLSDFFLGRGTNGWEFDPPAGSLSAFTAAIGPNQPLGIALRNLANFAGDPDGAFPPKQEPAGSTVIHPYPALSMWGNFSNLRRALRLMDSGTYEALSIADKTYIQTASCTVGMLAYEIDTVQQFDPTNLNNSTAGGLGLDDTKGKLMLQLGLELYNLMDEIDDPGTDLARPRVENRVLPRPLTKLNRYDNSTTPAPLRTNRNPRDYYSVPPEAYIEALRQQYTERTGDGYGIQAVNNSKLRMAELIMLNFQIRRDRTYGFKSSPAFGHYAIQLSPQPPSTTPSNTELAVYPSACDPDLFKINSDDVVPSPSPLVPTSATLVKARLGLSRLCGALDIPPVASYDLTKTGGYTPFTSTTQKRPLVLPKFPALYYIFPQVEHGLDNGPGEVIDKEPYTEDAYVKTSLGSTMFKPVQSGTANEKYPASTPSTGVSSVALSFPNSIAITAPVARFPDENRQVFSTQDFKVDSVKIKPRKLPGGFDLKGASTVDWRLPSSTNVAGSTANVPTNIIHAPSGTTSLVSTPVAVPFLDRAFFDGRQLMLARTLDLDIGMMRSDKTRLKGGQRGEPLLPMSGIVYAFREDSVREDAIARPAGTRMNATKPAIPLDPPLQTNGTSIKAVDNLPDPGRRIHGFRLRNGRQVKRDVGYESSGPFKDVDNYRGLSLFTDQPLYIQGDLNRHQTGADDTIGDPLEEFTGGANALIRGQDFNSGKFYNRGGGGGTGTKDDRFASLKGDRWRPTELLSDSVSILSENFCDGSISDMFVSYEPVDTEKGYQRHPSRKGSTESSSQRSVYHDASSGFTKTGLYGPGCVYENLGFTSFQNSDRPMNDLKTGVSGNTTRYDWLRENPNLTSYNETAAIIYEENKIMPAGDYTTPIKISRSGLPLLSRVSGIPITNPSSYKPLDIDQKRSAIGATYAYADKNSPDTRVRAMAFQPIQVKARLNTLMTASPRRVNDFTNINSIIVSGIVPSQPGNSYGGLHNFPRFIEGWKGVTLDYVGSFLQLSFSNYATAPSQMRAWEYDDSGAPTPPFIDPDPSEENNKYYESPTRQWGYDVALQLAPAGPAASRFVVLKNPRNEFYSEPQINDPYIQNLCKVATTNNFPGATNLNCTN